MILWATQDRSDHQREFLLVMDWKAAGKINEITLDLVVVPAYAGAAKKAGPRMRRRFWTVRLVRFGELWTPELQRGGLTISERICKRIMDLLVAVLSVFRLSLPILLIAAVLIVAGIAGAGAVFTQARRRLQRVANSGSGGSAP